MLLSLLWYCYCNCHLTLIDSYLIAISLSHSSRCHCCHLLLSFVTVIWSLVLPYIGILSLLFVDIHTIHWYSIPSIQCHFRCLLLFFCWPKYTTRWDSCWKEKGNTWSMVANKNNINSEVVGLHNRLSESEVVNFLSTMFVSWHDISRSKPQLWQQK